ncbi:MAG: hypothetical protein N3A61_08510, partial [Ignavibacteria bacterium]|nr:hypothetical protein [Ignavibacteria bacterium]
IAMGNAMTSLNKGEIQGYYNPALLPYILTPTVSITYGILSLDRKLNYLSYSSNLKPNAGFSIGIINSGVSNIDGRNSDGIHTETYSTSENAFLFCFGLKPSSKISIGATAKILYYYLFEEMKSVTASIDVGLVYLITDGLVIGAVVQDLKGKYHWNSTKLYGKYGRDFYDYFPLRKRISLSWIPTDYSFSYSGEFEIIGSSKFIRFGSEYQILESISIRGGVDQISLDNDLPIKPTFGLSFETEVMKWKPTFQYTYVIEPYSLHGIHLLSLSLKIL